MNQIEKSATIQRYAAAVRRSLSADELRGIPQSEQTRKLAELLAVVSKGASNVYVA